MAATLMELKRAYYIDALALSPTQAAAMTIQDLEYAFFLDPPAGGGGGDPTMGGDLSGTASNAQLAAGSVGTTELANLAVTDAKVAAANKDGTAGTASMRTLGTGATQAAAGNHTHANMEVTTNKNTNNGYAGLDSSSRIAYAQLPAGSTVKVDKSGGTWPARPTTRTDICVIWSGADPSPSIVTSPSTGGMYEGDVRWITA